MGEFLCVYIFLCSVHQKDVCGKNTKAFGGGKKQTIQQQNNGVLIPDYNC